MSGKLSTNTRLAWLVVYSSAPIPPPASISRTVPNGLYLHGLDMDAARALEVMWKCMHLPRIAADCCDTTPAAVRRFESIDVPHQIVFAPVQVLREHSGTLARALCGDRKSVV